MSDYISREAAIGAVKKERDYTGKFSFEEEHAWAVGFQQGITFALSDIAAIPAADVRPVVLCRDCKWYQIDELKKDGTADRRYKPSVCVLAEQRRDPNHFCADGKKREES